MTLYTHGSMSPILFDYSAKFRSDPLNSAHFLHLLWHIKDTIFDEECFLEFPLYQNAIRQLLALWNSRAAEQWGKAFYGGGTIQRYKANLLHFTDPSPLLKCASRLKIGAHAPLENYHRSMLVPYKELVFSAPVVHFTTYATCGRQLRAKHSLRDFVQYFQKTTDALPNDIDVRCEIDLGCGCALHPQEQQDSLDLVLEIAPRSMAPNGFSPPGLQCLTPVVLEQLLSCVVDYVYLGHFSNELLGKQFHVMLYNGLLLKKSGGRDEEVFTCYRIWSEDLPASSRK
ncbi:hypothetical protein Ddc_10365 [Ditylenchus destructor]|nr:hypothetical protein Ddc_10365 [Ditylenchus destructor]